MAVDMINGSVGVSREYSPECDPSSDSYDPYDCSGETSNSRRRSDTSNSGRRITSEGEWDYIDNMFKQLKTPEDVKNFLTQYNSEDDRRRIIARFNQLYGKNVTLDEVYKWADISPAPPTQNQIYNPDDMDEGEKKYWSDKAPIAAEINKRLWDYIENTHPEDRDKAVTEALKKGQDTITAVGKYIDKMYSEGKSSLADIKDKIIGEYGNNRRDLMASARYGYGAALGALNQAFQSQKGAFKRLSMGGMSSKGEAERMSSDIATKYASGAMGAYGAGMNTMAQGLSQLNQSFTSGMGQLASAEKGLATGTQAAISSGLGAATSYYNNVQNIMSNAPSPFNWLKDYYYGVNYLAKLK